MKFLPRFALLAACAATAQAADVFTENFESGTVPNWTLQGLWHVTQNFPANGTYALGFTQNENSGRAGIAGDYQTGSALDQSAFTPAFAVPPGRTVLRFKVIVADETTATQGQPDLFDRFSVTVVPQTTTLAQPNGAPSSVIVASSKPLPQGFTGVVVPEWNGVAAFRNVEVDLSPFAGSSVRLQFRFETLDAQDNNHPGVRVDDVRVTSSDLAAGDPVAGQPVGTTYATFGIPSINDAGQLAFRATLTAGGTTKPAVLAGAPPTVLVQSGDAAPGFTGGTFTNFRDPLLNTAGRVAFLGTANSGGVNTLGLWSNANGGTLALVARKGGPAPGVAGATFSAFPSVALPDGLPGPVFIGRLTPSTTVTTTNDVGIWATGTDGNLQLLLRKGEVVDTGLARKTVASFQLLSAVPNSPGQGRSYNANKQLALRLTFTDGTQMLMKKTVP
jgi:hypothetical protein